MEENEMVNRSQAFEDAICLSSSLLHPATALTAVSMASVRIFIACCKPEATNKKAFLDAMGVVFEQTVRMLEESGRLPRGKVKVT